MEHIKYDNRELHQVLVKDAVFVTSLRHPLSHLKSDLNYKYAKDGQKYNNSIDVLAIYLNQSTLSMEDLKFKYKDRGLQYIKVPKDLIHDSKRMDTFVKTELGKLFKSVFITEHFDESLVLLKRKILLGFRGYSVCCYEAWELHLQSKETSRNI